MYMNVIPAAPVPVPQVNGMGAARRVRPPGVSGYRGFGQVPTSAAQYIAQQLAALPSVSEAAMLLNTPTPSGAVLSTLYINGATSPQQAAQVVYQWAAEFCGQQQDTVIFGGTLPADCQDNGTAAANAAYPQVLAYYSALPASVWTTGTVSAEVANPQVFPSTPAPSQPLGQPMVQTGNDPGYMPPPTYTPVPATPAPAPPSVFPTLTPTAGATQQLLGGGSLAFLDPLINFLQTDLAGIPMWGIVGIGIGALLLMPRGR